MRLALWQGGAAGGAPLRVAGETAALAAQAAAGGARMLVLPEGHLTGYHRPGLAPADLAEVPQALARLGAAAREHRLWLVTGTHLAEPGGVLRNAAVVFGPDGRERGRYAKRALFGPWERATFRPGAARLGFAAEGLRVGVLICYDVEFPELVRAEAQAGADLVVVPTALMHPHARIARRMVPVRAMENQIFLAYVNRTGREGALRFTGGSVVAGPDGAELARVGARPEMLFADIDPAEIAATRAEASYLADLGRLGWPAP